MCNVIQEGFKTTLGVSSSPHTLSHRPHGLLRDKDMARKPVQDWVLGNETKVTAKQRQKKTKESTNSQQNVILYTVFMYLTTEW